MTERFSETIMKTIFIDDSPHVVSSSNDGVKINGHSFTWWHVVDLIETLEQMLNEHDRDGDTAVSQPIEATNETT